MSYSDLPQVDIYARYSEKSARRMLDVLNMESGFVCRKEDPDMGADFAVELISDSSNAMNWKFTLQLKSIEKLDLVDNKNYISLPFLTSRLHYLTNHLPAMGIVVFYSVQEDRCFYDYADVIKHRLTSDRGSDEWENNEQVSIRIPYTQVLDASAAKDIHGVFTRRFEQATLMQQHQGKRYDLPVVNQDGDAGYDFRKPADIRRFILDYGVSLIDRYDFTMLFEMIAGIPQLELSANKDLIYVAAITYAESGHAMDSSYFCTKLLRANLSREERELIEFIQTKNQLELGYITQSEFAEKLEEFLAASTNETDKVPIEINIVYSQLIRARTFMADLPAIEQRTDGLAERIDALPLSPRRKGMLALWNARNYEILLIKFAIDYLAEYQMRGTTSQSDMQARAEKISSHLQQMELRLRERLAVLVGQATEANDNYLRAQVVTVEVEYFLQKNIQYISFDLQLPQVDQDFVDHLQLLLSWAMSAYELFSQVQMFKDALTSAHQVLELYELAKRSFQLELPVDPGHWYSIKNKLEDTLGLEYEPMIFATLVRPKPEEREAFDKANLPLYAKMTDEQIARLARIQCDNLQLPEAFARYIIDFFNAFRLFYQRCTNERFEIHIVDSGRPVKAIFSEPVEFRIEDHELKTFTAASADVDTLLKLIGY